MGRDDPANGSNLPAPYRNPWGQLGDDLRAALADLRLRLRELLRRNAEGSLWCPGWWPRDLAPLFWPLLLALALGAVATGALVLPGAVAQAPRFAPLAPAAPASDGGSDQEVAAAPLGPPAAADSEAADLPPQAAPPAAPPDPLAPLLNSPEALGLILRAAGQPAAGLVVLDLAPAFAELAPAEQQRRALRWQQLAIALGYDHLELRDHRAGLLGRDALVGEGMILFNSPPPA